MAVVVPSAHPARIASSTLVTGAARRRFLLSLGAAVVGSAWLARPAQAFKYEDQEFEDKIQLAGSSLVLNGVGKRAVSILRGYVAGLYLSHKATSPEAVYATSGPKRVQIRMLLEVGAEEFVKAVNKGVGRNCSEAEKEALSTRLPQFTQNLQSVGKVRKNDLINIDFLPEQGTVLIVNGKQWGQAVPGADLYTAFLKVFLGEKPGGKRLKAGLLGEATS